jgi:ABC-type sugar transport system ATPase subunit
MTEPTLLQLTNIGMDFGPVKALQGVDFSLRAGEVHALCGENGAGKSTLMNLIAGNFAPTAGDIFIRGEKVELASNRHAASQGIAIVYQHLSLVTSLSVADNIFANRLPIHRWGLIDYRALAQQARALLKKFNIADIEPGTRLGELAVGQRQMVEIAKALAQNPAILILDEPTASVTSQQTETIFGIVRELRASGTGVIYISHRLDEIFALADRVTVLRDGRYQATLPRPELSRERLIQLMVGRDLPKTERVSARRSEVVLEVKNLTGAKFHDVSFQLHRGEILALAGLQGAGRTEVARAIFGADPVRAGQVWLRGQPLAPGHPADAVAAGLGYLPEERKTLGIFPEMSLAVNVVAVNPAASLQNGRVAATKMAQVAERFKARLNIVAHSVGQKVGTLSGGNQQKVVLAKWLLQDPDVLMIDEPTHGIDVGAKFEIYAQLRALAQAGKAILLISSELPEVLALADRILVLREGRLVGELANEGIGEAEVLALAAG